MVLDMYTVLYVYVYVALAVLRFYKLVFCTWIYVLLKSAVAAYISNSVLYKNILSLTEILIRNYWSIEVDYSMLGKLQHLSKKDI